MDPMSFDYHKSEYADYLTLEGTENYRYFMNQAIYMHALSVQQALLEIQPASVQLADCIRDEQGKHFALHGVARRLGQIWIAYRSILATARHDRTAPLTTDETKAVSRDLNAIYINIVGAIDNWAWCLLHTRCSAETRSLSPSRIGLFSNEFLKDPGISAIREPLDSYKEWFREIRSKRDPAAHRIPLTVPPAVLNKSERETHICNSARRSVQQHQC